MTFDEYFSRGVPKVNAPNVFRTSDGQYVNDQDQPLRVINNSLSDNPAMWTYQDELGKIYTPKIQNQQPTVQNMTEDEVQRASDRKAYKDQMNAWADRFNTTGNVLMTASNFIPVGSATITPITGVMKKGAITAAKTFSKKGIVGLISKYSLDPKEINNVNKLFREEEWRNFLASRNGNSYYRMVNAETEAAKHYSPKENYFVSHTTPWEEFLGINDPATAGLNPPMFHSRLYEFPTETFGIRKSSSWRGVLGDTDVNVMGKNHLLYGNTSSGSRGPVRVLSDANADYLGISPFRIGVKERPLTNGLYNRNPTYEDIYMGNQTVINGKDLKKAIDNSTYNVFENRPLFFMGNKNGSSGITRIIHMSK